ncbi:MAG: class I SAM-dependent methyltransferase [Bacteroidetes bacterium]|nr:class I SAM-dependent methyltransferase [Bacteroidota bacterium]
MLNDYKEINRKSWNNRVYPHIESAFYDHEAFLRGKNSLKDIELHLLGNIQGKSILHLQCHFGQDSISLARMGATVTGVDISDVSILEAKKIATELHADATFICCDLYDLPNHLDQNFDIVFTTYGTIGWLPDIEKWANLISRYLKPAGKLIFADFHPVIWMFDNAFENIQYRYFKSDPIVETETGTYANRDSEIEVQSIGWNHGLAEVLQALIQNDLQLDEIREYDYSPYNCFANLTESEPGKFRIAHLENKIPMVYSILGSKK